MALPPPDRPVKTGSRGDGADTRTVKVKAHVRKVRVPAPAGDVASSGGSYGIPEAKKAASSPRVKKNTAAVYRQQPAAQRKAILKHATGPTGQVVHDVHEQHRQRAEEIAHAQAAHDIMTTADKKTADQFNAAHPVKPKEKANTGLLATALNLSSKAAPVLVAAGEGPIALAGNAVVDKLTGSKINKTISKTASNAPKDAAELAATTPTSTYMLGKTAVTHPEKVPGMLAAPYVQLAKHPGKFITEHPVTAALMVQGLGRAPGSLAGRALRVAGKQSLERAPAELAGTTLKEPRRASRDAVVNTLQKRKDAKAGAPKVTPDQVRQRVDETYEIRRKQSNRQAAAAGRAAAQTAERRGLSKDEAKVFVAERSDAARKAAKKTNDRRFVQEYGSHWHVDPNSGAIVKPKGAVQGHIHASKADAEKVVERLGNAGHGEFAVKTVQDGEYGVVPKVAAEQLRRHQSVGTSKSTGARVLRASRTKFTNAVLPLSPKWLTGQLVEGGVRSAIHGAGPTSWLRERRVFNELERQNPGSGKAFRQRALTGGHYGGQLQEFRKQGLHETFNQGDAEGKLGRNLAQIGQATERVSHKPVVKQTLSAWNKYTDTVFEKINARGIEQHIQRAMLGREIKKAPALDTKLIGLSKKAVQEAAEGLKGTHAQVEMARGVERAYGKYSNFDPGQREFKLHWAPFLPWYKNSVQFLASVLPKDHPALTSLLAAGNAATQKDRKKLGLSLYASSDVRKPGFLQGTTPSGIRIGHYTPFGIAQSSPSESLKGLPLPQFQGAHSALGGLDWKGDPLKRKGEGARWQNAALSQLEALVPGVGPVARITGAEDTVAGKKGAKVDVSKKALLAAAEKQFNPLHKTGGASASSAAPAVKITPIKVKPVRVKPVRVKPVR